MEKFFAQAQHKAHDRDSSSSASSSASSALASSTTTTSSDASPPLTQQKLPKGVVLGKDGKPCRSCTSVRDWMAMAKGAPNPKVADNPATTTATTSHTSTSTAAVPTPMPSPSDCPPDVDTLGTHTWTLLHSISASYPSQANPAQQQDMRQFLQLFARLYPCWVCAEDFEAWMQKRGNEPKVEGREGLGRWMCEAHNEVNRKLGKREFDCALWKERWRDGWADRRCD